MQPVAAARRQALGEGHDHRRAARLLQAPHQRHGVGGPAEEFRPHAFAHARRLVRQQSHRFAAREGLVEHAHPPQVRRRQHGTRAGASNHHQGLDPAQFRRAIQHRERRAARGVERRDLETTQVRREKDDAVAARARGNGRVPALAFDDQPGDLLGVAKPDRDQLGDALSGSADRRAQQRGALRIARAHARAVEVFAQARGVGRRAPVHQPTQRRSGAVQPRKRQPREQAEQRNEHEFGFVNRGLSVILSAFFRFEKNK